MRYYWLRDRFREKDFHIFWDEGNKNLTYYFIKHQTIWNHITTS